MNLFRRARAACQWLSAEWRLPQAARSERGRDRANRLDGDPGQEALIEACVAWLCRAQDFSTTRDGGVAHNFSLVSGWSSSYPETTGYIVPTFLELASQLRRDDLRARARRMLDWFVAIQLESGAFQGGKIDSRPVVPVVFNTGQILLGLAAGVREFGAVYRESTQRAADWLVEVQDPDGCWRKGGSPFALSGDRTYDTHVAWGLLEAARATGERRYGEAALRNIRWALTRQNAKGWFADCCLSDPRAPLTHTLGYALRGVLEGFVYERDPRLLDRARLTADGLLGAMRGDGFLPGMLADDWQPRANWACLTGTAQVAHCWLLMFAETRERRYLTAANAALGYVRCRVHMTGEPDTVGAVKGSYPVDGDYMPYGFPNWAAKFLLDATLMEQSVHSADLKRAAG